MKTITLQEAFAIIENASAIIIDNDAVTYPSLYELSGEDENEFMFVKWSDGENDFNLMFREKENKEVKIVGGSMFLTDNDGDEAQISILTIKNLE